MMLHKLLLAIYNFLPLPAGHKTRLHMAIRKTKVKVNVLSARLSEYWKRRVVRKFSRAVFSLTQRLLHFPNERKLFFTNHGYPLNLKNPRSFNEKLVWRKIYDRNPLFPRVTDKYLVREYVREKLGAQQADEVLIPILFYGNDPAAIPFDDLPDRFVIKPSHASGHIILVRDKHEIDRDAVIATCKEWLSDSYGYYRHEWAYQKLKPMILVEPLLLDEDNNVPREVKFHVFHGKCKRIVVIVGRYNDLKQSNFDENWNYIETEASYPMGPPLPRPANLPEMLRLAEKLAEDFDYIRVDQYDLRGHIYFSELTLYTNSGDINYKPTQYDFDLGANWKIVPGYWKNKSTSPVVKPGH